MSDENERKPWTMPEWMKPYEPFFQNTGGWTVEDLYNCPREQTMGNIVLGAMVVAIESQITLLYRMKNAGLLSERMEQAGR